MNSPVQTPLRNAVTHEDRVGIALNSAGLSAENPIIGSNRYEGSTAVSGEGINLRVRFSLADVNETIVSATALPIDDEGVANGNPTNIKSLFSRDLTNLRATADLVAGRDLSSGTTAQRVLIAVTTSYGRRIQQQAYVRDVPSNAVTLNGQETTSSEPLVITMATIDPLGGIPASFRCAFFSSWNDEVARQHGAESVNLSGAIRKPYGGAKTVEVFRVTGPSIFNPLNRLVEETPCEDVTTISWGPSSSGETLTLAFRFRSATGSNDSIVVLAYVRFDLCGSTGPAPPTSSCPDTEQKPCIIAVQDTFTINTQIEVDILDFGDPPGASDSYAEVRVLLTGYKGGVAEEDPATNPGFPIANVVTGTQEETYTTPGQKTIVLGSNMTDATLIIATVEAGDPSDPEIGTSAVFVATESDVGDLPEPPTISNVSYNFSTNTVQFDLDDFGWPTVGVDVFVKPLHGIIRNLSGQEQSFEDVSIDVDGAATSANYPAGAAGGTRSFGTGFSPTPDAVAVWASNTFGTSDVFILEEGFTDSGVVKHSPVISGASLTGSLGDTIEFTLDDAGENVGNFTANYFYVTDTGSFSGILEGSTTISPTPGTKSFTVRGGDEDLSAVYFVYLEGEQGPSAVLSINNVSA